MKKIIRTFAFAAVAAAAITACNKEIDIATPVEGHDFVYTFAIGHDAAMTKAVLASDATGKFAQWESGDRLGSITTKTSGYSNITPANGDTPATFSIYSQGGLSEGNTITVWYPYGGSTQSNATAVNLVIPEEQHHLSDGKFDFDAMPMVAKQIVVTSEMVSNTNNTTLATINFANIGSVLNFKIFSTDATYATEKVVKVTFNAKNAAGSADANIGGTFSKNLSMVDPADEETLSIGSFTAGVSSIVTKPYADAAIGTDKASALDLYMVVAPGEYKGTIVVLTDAAEYTYTLSSAKTFVRSGVKAFGLDLNSANATRVEKITIDYVTLPWNYAGGTSADLNAIDGVTTDGLGSDYAENNAPYRVRFDGTGDYIQVKTDAAIQAVSVGYKMFGSSASYLNIFESTDGTSWGNRIDRLTIPGTQNQTGTLTTTATFNAASRFVKIVFEKGGNVGIGAISITKKSSDPAIVASDIYDVPAIGCTDESSTYTALNFVTDDVEVSTVTGCVSDADAATGDIFYSVTPNYESTEATGTIVLQSAGNNAITKTITVHQLGSSLTVSKAEVIIPADDDEATFTITSPEFDWSITADDDTHVLYDDSGNASNSASTVTVTSDLEATDAVQTIATLTIIRNSNNSDPQAKQVVIKKAAAGEVSYTVTFPDDNSSSNGLSSYTGTWTAMAGSFSLSITNFNNNAWNNNWTYIKCGRKNNASVATIITDSAISEAIKTIKITIDALTASKINSIILYISSDGSSWAEGGTFTKATGEQSVTISNPQANRYYKLVFDCASGSSNGLLTLSKIVYTTK